MSKLLEIPSVFTDFVRGLTSAPEQRGTACVRFQETPFTSPCGSLRWLVLTYGARRPGHPIVVQTAAAFQQKDEVSGTWAPVHERRGFNAFHGHNPDRRATGAQWALLRHADALSAIADYFATGASGVPAGFRQ